MSAAEVERHAQHAGPEADHPVHAAEHARDGVVALDPDGARQLGLGRDAHVLAADGTAGDRGGGVRAVVVGVVRLGRQQDDEAELVELGEALERAPFIAVVAAIDAGVEMADQHAGARQALLPSSGTRRAFIPDV